MSLPIDDVLRQIATAQPANEAEVETKIVLHVLRLLGYSDIDRADKVKVRMHFGRDVVEKIADFILYNGAERSLPTALLTVETKRVGESLDSAVDQARSYATWAGTPFIMACNGESLLVAQFIPGAGDPRTLIVAVSSLVDEFDRLRSFVGRTEAVLAKERISYISTYLPHVEHLPPTEFFREYLLRVRERFSQLRVSAAPLAPPTDAQSGSLQLPVIAIPFGNKGADVGVDDFADQLQSANTLIFLEGAPGSGKSTFCRRVAWSLAERALAHSNDGVIPIYLDLGKGLPNTVFASFRRSCEDLGVRVFPELFSHTLRRGRIVLLLDGLDEMSSASTAVQNIRGLLSQSGIYGTVISARSGFFDGNAATLSARRFRIRPLTPTELHSVLILHLKHPERAADLVKHSALGLIPDLRYAMTALMAIRVANETPDWDRLSTFDLYLRYVELLHNYFNSPMVRGTTGQATAPSEAVAVALSEAAHMCRVAQGAGYTLSLVELSDRLKENNPAATTALLNCGVVTSEAGKAVFIHRSFEEFGLAFRLVKEFRKRGANGLNQSHLTNDAYRIAGSAFGVSDEPELIKALSHRDRQIRRIASGLVARMQVSTGLESELWKRLESEKSDRVWIGIARILFGCSSVRFLAWLESQIQVMPISRLDGITWAFRKARDARTLQLLYVACGARPTRLLVKALFDLALYADDTASIELLTSAYVNLKGPDRLAVARILGRPGGQLREILISALLQVETGTRPLLRLLVMSDRNLFISDSALISDICCRLKNKESPRRLKRRERRKLRVFAKRLKQTANISAVGLQLAEICDRLGAKLNNEPPPTGS